MHIPDGFLDFKTAAATGALSAVAAGVALRRLNRDLPRNKIPLMGLAAAFVFVAQMINFPVAGGTSGHLMGGVLVAVLLGPAAGVVVLAAVLTVQCFLFADGGILALGANVFNMGVIGCVGGYAVYRGLWGLFRGEQGRFLAVALASWCSTVLSAVCCAGELAWSGIVPWSAAFPAMANVHMLIGVGEAVITTLVLSAIGRARPELLRGGDSSSGQSRWSDVVLYGAIITAGLLLFVAPFASAWPDGLEAVAARLGFDRAALGAPLVASPLKGYAFPGLGSTVTATVVAGLAGSVIMFIIGLILARVAVSRKRDAGKKGER